MSSSYRICFCLILLSQNIAAQTKEMSHTSSVEILASATVTDNLQMLTIRNLDLINPVVEGDKILVSPISSPFAGNFRVMGNPNSRIRITYRQKEVLKELKEGVGQVSIEYSISAAQEDMQFQSTLLDVDEGNVTLSEQGEIYLWLGATMDLAKAIPGIYTSEFIVELEYL